MDARGSFLRAAAIAALVFIPLNFPNFPVNAENLVKIYSDNGSRIDFDTDLYHRSHGIELVRIRVQMRGLDTYQTYLVDARESKCCLIDVDGVPVPRAERKWVAVTLPIADKEAL